MGSHPDQEHMKSQFLNELRIRGEVMEDLGKNKVTNDRPLLKWRHDGVSCELLPDDRQDILRISIGGGDDMPIQDDYCRVRGDIGKCVALLEKALAALRNHPS